MNCEMFETMPANPGTLNACTRCCEMQACRTAAGITEERATALKRSREITSFFDVAPESMRVERRTPPMLVIVKPCLPAGGGQCGGDEEVGAELKQEVTTMATKERTRCKCGCGKFATYEGYAHSCYKKASGMSVAKAKRLAGGGATMKPPKISKETPSPAVAAVHGGRETKASPTPPLEKGDIGGFAKGAVAFTGTLTLDISGWNLDRLIKLKELVEA